MAQPVPMMQPANRANLKKLARLWLEGQTGQIRDGNGVVEIINGEPQSREDLNALERLLRAERKVRFRARELEGNPLRSMGTFLFEEALDAVTPNAMDDITRLDETAHTTQTGNLPLAPDTIRFIATGHVPSDLIRMEPAKRATVKHELAALVLLGLFKTHSESPEAQERIWLKTEFRRLTHASPEDPRDVVGVGPQASKDQVAWLARKKVQRCVTLQQTSTSPRVRQVALEVGAAIMAAARSLA
jgi:hypothetical protein